MRTTSAARRTALVEALAAHAPAVRLTGLAAGFHAVAHLPEGADERAVVAAARSRAVGLYGMSPCRSSGATDPVQLVLGFGDVGERAIAEGVGVIGDLLNSPTGVRR
jgi:GntR family transcriptional regulator/MocR family aminotransferase